MRVAAAQTAEYRNDVPAALAALHDFSRDAEAAGAALLCFPEGICRDASQTRLLHERSR